MCKRHVFEGILNTDFRWPMEGDIPFTEAEDPENNAYIEEDDFTRLILMTEGYKRAADIAITHSEANREDRHYLVYPDYGDSALRLR